MGTARAASSRCSSPSSIVHGSSDQAAANGRFEIERATGRVVVSTLLLQSGNTLATITVKFAADQKLGMWLPLTMDEQYRGQGIVTGQAKYSAYRQFRVDTSEAVKH